MRASSRRPPGSEVGGDQTAVVDGAGGAGGGGGADGLDPAGGGRAWSDGRECDRERAARVRLRRRPAARVCVYVAAMKGGRPGPRAGRTGCGPGASSSSSIWSSPRSRPGSVRSGPAPVVLVDVADNVGGGSPGNGTVILHALARQGVRDCRLGVLGPGAVAAAQATSGPVSERSRSARRDDPSMGPMFVASGAIRRCGRVLYRRTGSYMRGQQVDMGEVVFIESTVGPIVLTQNRVVPFDDDHLRVLGIEPRTAGAIVAKGAIAWKAAFGDYAGRRSMCARPATRRQPWTSCATPRVPNGFSPWNATRSGSSRSPVNGEASRAVTAELRPHPNP